MTWTAALLQVHTSSVRRRPGLDDSLCTYLRRSSVSQNRLRRAVGPRSPASRRLLCPHYYVLICTMRDRPQVKKCIQCAKIPAYVIYIVFIFCIYREATCSCVHLSTGYCMVIMITSVWTSGSTLLAWWKCAFTTHNSNNYPAAVS